MTIGKERAILVSVLIVLLLINFTSALTGSIGNAKMVLYPNVNGWTTTTIEKSILVKNVNDELISVTLEPDVDGKEFLEVLDGEFTLEPGDEKKAEFLVKVRKEGSYEGKINVFFSSVGNEGPGVVLSSVIIVKAEKGTGYEESDETDEGNELGDNETVSVMTGGAIGVDDKNGKSKIPLLLGVSSFVLLIILVGLIFLMNKSKIERKKSGGEKIKRKRK